MKNFLTEAFDKSMEIGTGKVKLIAAGTVISLLGWLIHPAIGIVFGIVTSIVTYGLYLSAKED